MKVEKDQIGGKEIFALIVFMIGTKASDMTTEAVFEKTLNASWMVMFGSLLMILPSLVIVNLLLKKFQEKDLLEISQSALGRPIAFIIGFFLFFIILMNTFNLTLLTLKS